MLETLKIKNFVIIESAEIRFKEGLNILSGETGAGKSTVIEAISLILGDRANTDLIRAGCDEAVVEGLFDLREMPLVRKRLEKLGFSESAELLVKRSVHRAGKHRIYVNGELATLTILNELCEGLIDLCSQHEHQSLTRATTQLDLLDRYGGLSEQARAFGQEFTAARALAKERDELQAAESDRSKRADFLSFQIEELRSAALNPGEDEKLHAEKILLQSGESRVQVADAIRSAIESDENGGLNTLRTALQKLRGLVQIDERASSLRDGLERAIAEAEEVAMGLNRYLSSVDLDPDRLAVVQERLALIADLRRKYGATVSEMCATQEKIEDEFAQLGCSESRLKQIDEDLARAEEKLRAMARKLSSARKKVADLLATSVTGEIRDLKMGEAKFMVELTAKENIVDWNPTGSDAIQFVVQTNRGEPARPMGRVASGGELSRMMLAIRRVIADKGRIGVYLFDEIDAGIGGQTAFQVGKKLRSVASYNQVICITHLPQVASFADHHLSVRKSTIAKRTVTEIVELGKTERKEELARMLGGPELTRKSLENAAELIELAH